MSDADSTPYAAVHADTLPELFALIKWADARFRMWNCNTEADGGFYFGVETKAGDGTWIEWRKWIQVK